MCVGTLGQTNHLQFSWREGDCLFCINVSIFEFKKKKKERKKKSEQKMISFYPGFMLPCNEKICKWSCIISTFDMTCDN